MRVNKVALILGKRGTGKSYYAINDLIPSYQKAHPKQRILIVDTLDHPAYRFLNTITKEMLPRWKGQGIYRIYDKDTDAVLEYISLYVKNSLIIFEDASKYIRKTLQEDVRRFILDSKQKNLDLIFQFHGFAFAPPELFRIVDTITMFKTDNPQYRKSEIPNYEDVLIAYELVRNSKNQYEKKTILIY